MPKLNVPGMGMRPAVPSGASSTWDIDQEYTDAFAANNTGTTYYLDPDSGSNSNDGLSKQNAFLTPAYAAGEMSGGDELVVVDGTYTDNTDLEFGQATFPAGSAGAYTIVRAETPFGVRINTGVMSSLTTGLIDDSGVAYIWFDGFICNVTGDDSTPEWVHQLDGNKGRWTRIISRKQSNSFDNVFASHVAVEGTNTLIQDCAFCGSGRYQIQTGGDIDMVLRRVVMRLDFANTAQPSATFINYSATDVICQNVITVDSNDVANSGQEDQPTYAGLYDREFGTRNKYKGCIVLNCDVGIAGCNVEGSTSTDIEMDHSVIWGTTGGDGLQDETNNNSTHTNLTLGNNANNNFAGPNGQDTPSSSRISDTTPANILDNTPGAVIKFAHGKFLTHFGDTDYDTVQTDRLWPWPYESEIRSLFAEAITAPSGSVPASPDSTRGFTDDAVAGSLTEYIFTQGTDSWNNGDAVDDFYA